MTLGKNLHWRFINSGPCATAFNMALDEALMRSAPSGPSATLRVYAWRAPSVSLGYHQRHESRLDLERCRALGVEVVRRITGGREVFHDRELTYSFSGPEGCARLGGSIAESYLAIAEGLRCALRLLGIQPDMPRTATRGQVGPRRSPSPCFSSVSRYEISAGGKKLVGSAQRRCSDPGAFIQQGSLLIRNAQNRLLELLPGAGREKENLAESSRPGSRATGLEEVLGRPVEFEEVARAMHGGFEEAFGCRFAKEKPTERERELARELERGKYKIFTRGETAMSIP